MFVVVSFVICQQTEPDNFIKSEYCRYICSDPGKFFPFKLQRQNNNWLKNINIFNQSQGGNWLWNNHKWSLHDDGYVCSFDPDGLVRMFKLINSS